MFELFHVQGFSLTKLINCNPNSPVFPITGFMTLFKAQENCLRNVIRPVNRGDGRKFVVL